MTPNSFAMKRIIALLLLSQLISACHQQTPQPDVAPTARPTARETAPSTGEMTGALQADVQLNKESYLPGERIEIMVVATNLKERAWVGIVPTDVPHGPEEVNEKNHLSRLYLDGNPDLQLAAPDRPGTYDMRLNDSDDSGTELASRTFTVISDADAAPDAPLEESK